MLTAISVILMLISGSMDTGKLGTLVLLSFLPVILITEGMRTGAVALWGATLLCGWMLIPDKTLPLAYGLFFGPFAFLWMAKEGEPLERPALEEKRSWQYTLPELEQYCRKLDLLWTCVRVPGCGDCHFQNPGKGLCAGYETPSADPDIHRPFESVFYGR